MCVVFVIFFFWNVDTVGGEFSVLASSSGSSVDFVMECGQLCWLMVNRQGRSLCTMVWAGGGGSFSGDDFVRSLSIHQIIGSI